jgi:hypothetical protein
VAGFGLFDRVEGPMVIFSFFFQFFFLVFFSFLAFLSIFILIFKNHVSLFFHDLFFVPLSFKWLFLHFMILYDSYFLILKIVPLIFLFPTFYSMFCV